MPYPYNPRIEVFYRDEVALSDGGRDNFSKTPTKPRRFVEYLAHTALAPYIRINPKFNPATVDDLILAHTAQYVDDFMAGREWRASSNGLDWDPEFARSVLFTTGSLCAALDAALRNPAQITHSPTGGFHHATPDAGGGFCTFSGQVVAGLRAWYREQAVGAWVDLDAHGGNSIEDTRKFHPALNKAIPFNLNPRGTGEEYLRDLRRGLDEIGEAVVSGRVTYVAFAHGADSHVWDDLGGQVSTSQWVEASRIVYGEIAGWAKYMGRPVPVVTALFGGYRDDSPESVLSLHTADLAAALEALAGVHTGYVPTVTPNPRKLSRQDRRQK
jgi:acetoin utilization deacetylase AcuC-like enzyme